MPPLLTIVAVHWFEPCWPRVLIDSVRRLAETNPEIIIVDNSRDLQPIEGVTVLTGATPPTHAHGLDLGIARARGEFVLAIDIDAHPLIAGFDRLLIESISGGSPLAMACRRAPHQPCVTFARRDFLAARTFEPLVDYDPGSRLWSDVLSRGLSVVGLEQSCGDKMFPGAKGRVYSIGKTPAFYHQFWGTRFRRPDGRERDVIDRIERAENLLRRDAFLRAYSQIHGADAVAWAT